jgi:pimeloyl-ACP methyl ester carboxylesterase
MPRAVRTALVAVLVLAVAGLAVYTGWVGVEGSHRLVDREGTTRDCRTPEVQFGWEYEAINYDIADDAVLAERNADLADCEYEGTLAGDEVVTEDGIRIAGWYVPAGSGAGPDAPTVVLVHGFKANKSGILRYGEALHEDFNLVVYDARNTGRSTGTQTTAGVFEQRDLTAVLDWLEREKSPEHVGVLGNSLGAATALAAARTDERIEALALDSMHTRIGYQIEARVGAEYWSYPGTTWAIIGAAWVRTGANIGSIDAEDTVVSYGERPMMLIHGTADTEDLPSRTEAFHEQALELGVPVELHWCADSGHNPDAGMPVDVCHDQFGAWTHAFFTEALVTMAAADR